MIGILLIIVCTSNQCFCIYSTGIAVAGSGVGTFAFAPLMDILIDRYTWKGALLILAGVMLNIVLCGALFRPLISFKVHKQRRRYLRSLERFSRVSSRIPSDEGLDGKSICEHSNGIPSCMLCSDLEPLSHSLIQFPTYLGMNDLDLILPDIVPDFLRNSKSMIELSLIHGSSKKFPEESNIAFKNVLISIDYNFVGVEKSLPKDEDVVVAMPADVVLEKKPKVAKKALKSAMSNGVLKVSPHHGKHVKKRARFNEQVTPPRYRADIFYRGSLLKAGFLLNRGALSASCPDVFVHTRKKNVTLRARLNELGLAKIINSVRDSLDFSIFRSPIFLYFCLHCMLLNISRDIPYVYLPDMAVKIGIEDHLAPWLISIIGIVSSIGQVIMGYIGDLEWVNCLYFYIVMTTAAGIVTLVVPLLKTFTLLAIYCTAYGFFMSANYSLTTIIVVELLGMDQLTNAYGFVSLAEGLANLVGPPFAGTESGDLLYVKILF